MVGFSRSGSRSGPARRRAVAAEVELGGHGDDVAAFASAAEDLAGDLVGEPRAEAVSEEGVVGRVRRSLAGELPAREEVPDAVEDRGRGGAGEWGARPRARSRGNYDRGARRGAPRRPGEVRAPVVEAPRARASLREAEETKARRPGARGTRALFGTAKDPRAVRVHRCGARSDEGR